MCRAGQDEGLGEGLSEYSKLFIHVYIKLHFVKSCPMRRKVSQILHNVYQVELIVFLSE